MVSVPVGPLITEQSDHISIQLRIDYWKAKANIFRGTASSMTISVSNLTYLTRYNSTLDLPTAIGTKLHALSFPVFAGNPDFDKLASTYALRLPRP